MDNFNNLVELLKKISSSRYSHLLLMDDFNLREIDWNNCTTTVGEDHVATIFLECIRYGYVARCYLWLITLCINIEVGKIVVKC